MEKLHFQELIRKIKELREQTGCGLKEAKEAVECTSGDLDKASLMVVNVEELNEKLEKINSSVVHYTIIDILIDKAGESGYAGIRKELLKDLRKEIDAGRKLRQYAAEFGARGKIAVVDAYSEFLLYRRKK